MVEEDLADSGRPESDSKQKSSDRDRVRINTWIPRKLYNGILDIVSAEDETLTNVVRDALKTYINRYKRKGLNNE